MKVGVGLPSCVPGCSPDVLVDWARAAEAGPFASLGTVDRVRYGNYEPLVALSAAAAVTSRIQLATSILISPLRETTTLAKQIASLDALAGGRLVLGVAVGARRDDYDEGEHPYEERGRRLDDQLRAFREVWEDPAVGPRVDGRDRPTVLVGGSSGPAMARMAREGDGFVHAGGPPRAFARAADQARAAWADLGRPGEPQLWGMAYFALGDAADRGREYLRDYYAFTGHFAERIAEGLLDTPLAVRELVEGYADAGCDHLILFPAVADRDQIDRLADCLG
ncbi:LLM class flavin-dependent oxidoreductase [Egibacter rhizosphaerae]|uniref:LLM class flavin-dependent oxidoreductase n=1 Tax=Egibacter rhizosphaerae TaxID=1670831 RepID=A0A411YF78_9ACTN|nr:LLM class flavin-dependent oxidoreductase [Egibacter rhizosphaerae]QBI19839.1 LLM class flavin-dependent oxidoreductase [Egibacter rhizosphaerae]